jgi:predicted dienelactone hydrolase
MVPREKEGRMNVVVAAIATASATLMLGTPLAFAVGFDRVMVADTAGPALEAGIWYPSNAPATEQPLGLFRQTVAPGGAIAGRGRPLIVMSHGTGGSFEGHYDTALALAEAGFVVAAVTHTGDNYRDQSQFTQLDNRSRHIKALIDYVLASWPRHAAIDRARIGMFGFSAGGFTTLVIGGTPDMTRVGPFCAEHPDEILPHPNYAQAVYDRLAVKPEYHVVPNAGHFAFLAPCSQSMAITVPDICKDPRGFDRTAFHREFNAAAVAFFKEKLGVR